MKLIDVVRRVIIDPRKLTGYALDPDHPVGCHKARVFQQVLGFTRDNYDGLWQPIAMKPG
jgi:filamentous hemagglutinin